MRWKTAVERVRSTQSCRSCVPGWREAGSSSSLCSAGRPRCQGLVPPPAGHQGEAGGGESGGGGRTAAEVAGGRAQAHRQVRVLLVFMHRETLLLLLSWLSVEERARLGRSVRCWAALEGVVLGALGREGEGMLKSILTM